MDILFNTHVSNSSDLNLCCSDTPIPPLSHLVRLTSVCVLLIYMNSVYIGTLLIQTPELQTPLCSMDTCHWDLMIHHTFVWNIFNPCNEDTSIFRSVLSGPQTGFCSVGRGGREASQKAIHPKNFQL